MRSRIALAALLFCVAPLARAQSDPASLPARDMHEGLLVAADPYTDAGRYKARFGKKNPYEAGIMAVEVFFRNANDKPIRLSLEAIRLLLKPLGVDRQKLGALAVEDVADRILNKDKPDPTARRKTIPVPGRGPKKSRGKEWDELVASLHSGAFETDLLPPRSTVYGIFFFDIDSHYEWVPYARLYIPDLKFMDTSKPLLYFELDLGVARPR
jgi:hypothetical protein